MPPAAASTGDSGSLITKSPMATSVNIKANGNGPKTNLLIGFNQPSDDQCEKQYHLHHLRQPDMITSTGHHEETGKANTTTTNNTNAMTDQLDTKTSQGELPVERDQVSEGLARIFSGSHQVRMGSIASRQTDPAVDSLKTSTNTNQQHLSTNGGNPPMKTLRSLASSTNLQSYQQDSVSTPANKTESLTNLSGTFARRGENPKESIYLMPPFYYMTDEDENNSDDVFEDEYDNEDDDDDDDDDDTDDNGNCSDDYINYNKLRKLRFEPEQDFDLEDLEERLHLDSLDMPFRLLFEQDQVSISSAPPECRSSMSYQSHRSSGHHQSQHYITIEEIRSSRNSCWLCGCNWLQDHVSLDCKECGGYALSRPCPNCDGKCKQTWKRNISGTHDKHKALWVGECNLTTMSGSEKTSLPVDGSLSIKGNHIVKTGTCLPIEHYI